MQRLNRSLKLLGRTASIFGDANCVRPHAIQSETAGRALVRTSSEDDTQIEAHWAKDTLKTLATGARADA